MNPDFKVENHGSLWAVRPMSDACRKHLEDYTIGTEAQWFGGALMVEPRYIVGTVERLMQEEFKVDFQ